MRRVPDHLVEEAEIVGLALKVLVTQKCEAREDSSADKRGRVRRDLRPAFSGETSER